jgi:hypothetical protein
MSAPRLTLREHRGLTDKYIAGDAVKTSQVQQRYAQATTGRSTFEERRTARESSYQRHKETYKDVAREDHPDFIYDDSLPTGFPVLEPENPKEPRPAS